MDSKEKPSDIESKKENIEKKEIIFKIKFDKKKDEIYRIYEISDDRMAVELNNCIKIYSVKTFKLITEINNERVGTSIELKNKDIALADYSTVKFYKLTGNNYNYYQEISEEHEVFEIYELKNENLILCIRRKLNIYSKDKDKGEYKSILKIGLEETVGSILEIKNNILSLFLLSRCGTFCTADYSPYSLEIMNLEEKKMYLLSSGCFSRYDDSHIFYGCNFIIKKDKYLFARYAGSFEIYNIESNNFKKIYKINSKKDLDCLRFFTKTLCDYDNDNLIILPSLYLYKYDEISNKVVLVKKLEIGIKEILDIKKIKNKYYVAHNKNELLMFKS